MGRNMKRDHRSEHVDKHKQWAADMMKKYGYYVHGVIFDDTEYMDYHTHGLIETFKVPELQIIMPIPSKKASMLFQSVISNIELWNHSTFTDIYNRKIWLELPDDEQLPIILNWNIAMFGDLIVRIILPDTHGRFDDDPNCESLYAGQCSFIPKF